MRRRIGLLFLALALSGCTACTRAGAHPPADASMSADLGAAPPDLLQWDAAEGAGVAGRLVDEGGQPIGNRQVLACTAKYCQFGSTMQDGRFLFSMFEPPIDVAVKTLENDKSTPRQGAALTPVHLADRSLFSAGTLYVLNLPAGADLGPPNTDPQTIMAGDSLELTLRRADLRVPPGYQDGNVAARAIPAAHVPSLPALGEEKVLAAFALSPFGTSSKSPIGVRLPSDLARGTAVNFRTISEIDGRLSAPVAGQADGTRMATGAGLGIGELTWLVVSK